MEYQSYEDYARDVLGHQRVRNNMGNNMENHMGENMSNIPYSTYIPMPEDDYYEMPMPYDTRMEEETNSEMNEFYPEIYKIVYPMVLKMYSQNMGRRITKETLDEMVNEIYINVEPEDTPTPVTPLNTNVKPQMRMSNTKEQEVVAETRQRNFALDDLIRILLLREFLSPGRRPIFRPPVVGPHIPGRPPMGRPPIRPRGYDGLY